MKSIPNLLCRSVRSDFLLFDVLCILFVSMLVPHASVMYSPIDLFARCCLSGCFILFVAFLVSPVPPPADEKVVAKLKQKTVPTFQKVKRFFVGSSDSL